MSMVFDVCTNLAFVKNNCTTEVADATPRTKGLTPRRMSDVYANPCDAYKSGFFVHSSGGKNISNIADKLIRLAAKYTTRYASDMYYELSTLFEAAENDKTLCHVLSFRNDGIDSHPAGFDAKGNLYVYVPEGKGADEFRYSAYQHWLLALTPEKERDRVTVVLYYCEPSAYHWTDKPESFEGGASHV